MRRPSSVYVQSTSKTLASELRLLREAGRPYAYGADDQGRDIVRDAILDPATSVEDIAYFAEAIISIYDSQRKSIEKGLELCIGKEYTKSTRTAFGLITGAFEAGQVKSPEAPCHLLSTLDFTVQAMYFRLGILKTSGSASAKFIEQSLRRAREAYDETINKAYAFQREQLSVA